MRRKFLVSMLAVFAISLAGTVAWSARPGCNSCKKDGCPAGYCYVDCVGCCYNDPRYGTVCFR